MFSLPLLELSRFKRHALTRAALIVVILLPTIYGGVYLWANWNPSANLDKLNAAVVNLDEGSTDPSLHAGDELVDKITDPQQDAGFTWNSTDVNEAAAGLDSGKYTAVLTIPADFSKRITSTAHDDPERTELRIQTNDANNYVSGQIASRVLTKIRANLNETTTSKYISQVYVGFNDIHSNILKAADGADQLHDGASQLETGAGDLQTGAGKLASGAGQLSTGATTLSQGLTKLDLATGKAVTATNELSKGAGDLNDGLSTAHSSSKKLADGAQQVADGTGKLHDKADQATRRIDDLHSRAKDLTDATVPRIDQAAKDFEKNRDAVRSQLSQQLKDLQARYPDDPQVKKLVDQATAIGDDLDRANERAVDDYAKAKDLRRKVESGADDAVKAVDAADKQIGTLDKGAKQVAKGTSQLSTGLGTLSTGAGKLDRGAQTLASGTKQLHSATGEAATGASKLASGAKELTTGASALETGAKKLKDGAHKLDDGAQKLATQVREGAKEVPTYSASDRDSRSQVVALPVDGIDTPKNAVSTYGEGMAPLFVNIAMWIGGLITYMVLGAMPTRALATSAKSSRVVGAGWLPGVLFGSLQVLVLFGVLAFFLDFTVSSWVATLLFSFLVTASYHAIHQMLCVVFGSIGRLFALVLLILQLSSGGGTYPIQTAPPFLQALSPWLPMTWGIRGLRAIVSGGDPAHVWQAVGMLVLFGLGALVISVVFASMRRTIKLAELHPSFSL